MFWTYCYCCAHWIFFGTSSWMKVCFVAIIIVIRFLFVKDELGVEIRKCFCCLLPAIIDREPFIRFDHYYTSIYLPLLASSPFSWVTTASIGSCNNSRNVRLETPWILFSIHLDSFFQLFSSSGQSQIPVLPNIPHFSHTFFPLYLWSWCGVWNFHAGMKERERREAFNWEEMNIER